MRILFVFFISLVIRSVPMRGMISSGLMNKSPLERMLLELEKLQVIEDDSGNMSEPERTRKQNDFVEALEKFCDVKSREIKIKKSSPELLVRLTFAKRWVEKFLNINTIAQVIDYNFANYPQMQ